MTKLAQLHAIVRSGRPGVIDRFAVSPKTAAHILGVHGRLSPKFQKKFLDQRIDIMCNLAGHRR